MDPHDEVLEMLAWVLNEPEPPTERKLHDALRLLCKYRSQLVAESLIEGGGTGVRQGPFAGMVLTAQSAEGCYVPKLLGTYEQELHPVVRSLATRGYEAVVNVGCAEGYYAVGLARLLGGVTVHAFDTDDEARRLCLELAAENGVADRVVVGETFRPADFAAFANRRTVVVCDIEGAEVELLDPAKAPALASMDLLVELHDVFVSGCTRTVRARFEPTHAIERLTFTGRSPGDFAELSELDNLDQLLAVWEWRLAGNDWLWLEARGR